MVANMVASVASGRIDIEIYYVGTFWVTFWVGIVENGDCSLVPSHVVGSPYPPTIPPSTVYEKGLHTTNGPSSTTQEPIPRQKHASHASISSATRTFILPLLPRTYYHLHPLVHAAPYVQYAPIRTTRRPPSSRSESQECSLHCTEYM